MIKLNVESPFPGMVGHFGLLLPTEVSAESFDDVVRQIEFRRRCMNQGFDNLIELLEMHKKTILRVTESEKNAAAEEIAERTP